MGQKLYQETQDGGIRFISSRKGEVRIPNYVYDIWLPLLGATAIGVYSMYCRLEREDVVKAMSKRRIAKMCRIGTKKLDDINDMLQECGFVRITEPNGYKRLMHWTIEIEVFDPPVKVKSNLIIKYQQSSGYEILSPWLQKEDPEAPNDVTETLGNVSGDTKQVLDDALPNASNVVSLGLYPLCVENNASRVSPSGDELIGIKVIEPKDIQTEYVELPLYEYATELVCPECNHHQEWPKSNRERKKKTTLTCSGCGLLWKVTISYDTGGNDVYKAPLPRQEWIILLDDSIPNIGNRLTCDENECKQFMSNWSENASRIIEKLQWAASQDWLRHQKSKIVARVNAAYETTTEREIKEEHKQPQQKGETDYSKLETIEPDWMEL